MSVRTREAAATWAEAQTRFAVGVCQVFTRTAFGLQTGVGDVDHDGDADAVDGWLSEPASARHYGDRNPPRGVPTAFSGGSRGFGHRAPSVGGGKVRSTDMGPDGRYRAGSVATVTIAQVEAAMGVRYTGWSSTISGQVIPGAPKPPAPKPPKPAKTEKFAAAFYNIDNNRNADQVAREIRALLTPKRGPRPLVLGLSEAIRYPNLPKVEGYRLIRDRSTKSRDNIAAYVRNDVPVSRIKWHDMEAEWVRPHGGGMHEPRAFLEFYAGEIPVVVAHMAQLSAKGAPAAQAEQLDALVDVLVPWHGLKGAERALEMDRPRLLLWDRNRATIAKRIKGKVVGDKIDRAEVRNIEALRHVYKTKAAGVPLLSNHGHAFKAVLAVDAKWLR